MRRTRSRWFGVLVAPVLAVGLLACSPSGDTGGGADSAKLTIGLNGDVTEWDSAEFPSAPVMIYIQAVYDTLIKREPDGTLVPMLATEWSYDESRTALALTLRDDVTFTDGTAFDGAAVKENLERFRDANAIQSATMSDLREVEVVDETHVVLHLVQPNPAFEVYLSDIAGFMQSPAAFEDDTLKTEPVGSGPYTLDRAASVVGSEYVFQRNEDYWGDPLPFEELRIKNMPDETARLNALKSGQIDTTIFNTVANASEAEAAGFTYVPSEVDWAGMTWYDRGGDLNPALGDVRVRQALNYAIDRETLLRQLQGGRGTLTDQIWGPDSDGFVADLDGTYAYDVAKAKSLLAEAGYADGVSLTLPTGLGFDPTLEATLTQQWADAGITVNWQQVEPSEFGQKLHGAEFAGVYLQWFQPVDWYLVSQFVSGDAAWNVFGHQDETVNSLVDRIRVASGEEQKALLEELNTYVVDQAWFGPFYRVEQLLFTDADVTVVPQAQQGSPSLYNYSPAR
ncbi:ABC transporter substrate-binding protein [Microbacterium resistens]|uniref:ABC transporter substrate-binding protein n=1 Tax=Microbacterium resistens TaxID=156977 RepID=UPI001C582318|nr:ABC transporter substrate-binding protein [Microbacterium resistens]MBW1638093.1 ABC transporter substrate-binding protein [Microbacterium resistens]